MCPRKNKDFYTEEELADIKKQWLKDKARIDADPAYDYIYDKDREYAKHLNNKNLQTLFKHSARLFRDIQHENELILFPGEEQKIIKTFREIENNGYYSNKKKEEKKVRVHFGKICSRQSFRRYKFRG